MKRWLWFIALVCVGAVAGAHLFFAARNGSVGQLGDEAVYLVMADWFATRFGHDALDAEFIWKYTQFPPLFPLVLGVFGAGSGQVELAHVLTSIITLLAAVATYFWSRSISALTASVRLIVVAFWMLIPYSLFGSVVALSEPLYTALSLVALAVHARGEGGARNQTAAAMLVVVAALTRAVGMALVLAFLAKTIHSRCKGRWRICLIVLLPLLAWGIASATYFGGARWYVGDTVTRFTLGAARDAPAYLLHTAPLSLYRGWLELFDVTGNRGIQFVGAGLLVLSLSGLVRRAMRGRLDALYVLVYLGFVWLWPYPEHAARFLWPVSGILIFYAADITADLMNWLRMDRRIRAIVVIAVFAIVTPSWIYFLHRLNVTLPVSLEHMRTSRLMLRKDNDPAIADHAAVFKVITDAMKFLGAYVPANECVFSAHQEMMMFFSRRGSLPHPLPLISDSEFHRKLAACDYVNVLYLTSHPSFPHGYPAARLNGATIVAEYSTAGRDREIMIGRLFRLPREDVR